MRAVITSMVLLMGALTSGAQAAGTGCDRPETPVIPDGATVSDDELSVAGAEVRAFVDASQAYLKCLDDKAATYGEDITDAQRGLIDVIYNAGVEEMQVTAGAYNAAVQAWRARQEN